MKNPLTPTGIESATFRFVAQHEMIYNVGKRRMDEHGVLVESYGQGRAKYSKKAPSQCHFAQRNCHTGWHGIHLGSCH